MRPHRPGGLQDLAAFPKYEVVFLNDHPLAESDAARMQAEGLWNDDDFVDLRPRSRARATIEGGEAEGEEGEKATDKGEEGQAETPRAEPLELLTLHYTHKGNTGPHAYLCALPSANRTGAQTSTLAETHPEPESDAAASWLALSHLDGKCLYWREPWFTYAWVENYGRC
jgi:protein OS-9